VIYSLTNAIGFSVDRYVTYIGNIIYFVLGGMGMWKIIINKYAKLCEMPLQHPDMD
jgi:hypothetical protein